VARVIIDVSKEIIAAIFKVEIINKLAVTRATRRNIIEDGILDSHRCEIIKPYIALTG
jgi:hypothetical protein